MYNFIAVQVQVKVTPLPASLGHSSSLLVSLRHELLVALRLRNGSHHMCQTLGFTVQHGDALVVRRPYKESLYNQILRKPGWLLGERDSLDVACLDSACKIFQVNTALFVGNSIRTIGGLPILQYLLRVDARGLAMFENVRKHPQKA